MSAGEMTCGTWSKRPKGIELIHQVQTLHLSVRLPETLRRTRSCLSLALMIQKSDGGYTFVTVVCCFLFAIREHKEAECRTRAIAHIANPFNIQQTFFPITKSSNRTSCIICKSTLVSCNDSYKTGCPSPNPQRERIHGSGTQASTFTVLVRKQACLCHSLRVTPIHN